MRLTPRCVDIGNPVAVRPADYPRDSVGFPLHEPSTMSCHTLRNVEFQALYSPLRQDSKVCTDLPTDLRHFLHGVVYLVHTGIS